MVKNTIFSNKHTINCQGKILDLSIPLIMGILNITPDSFYNGGKYITEKKWLQHTEEMLSEGAAIIDIGGASTRPGAKEISETEELKRLVPALKSIIKTFQGIIISVDTYRASVARIAIENGASIINDVSAGTFDKDMFKTIAEHNVPYIMMHIKGTPLNMQVNPEYENVVKEITGYFSERIQLLKQSGVKDIIIDPGFGFGKTIENNYQILNKLDLFKIFELPILVGLSRKSMINKILKIKPDEALNGTTVLNTIALIKGAKILRVHDVKQAMETIKIVGSLVH